MKRFLLVDLVCFLCLSACESGRMTWSPLSLTPANTLLPPTATQTVTPELSLTITPTPIKANFIHPVDEIIPQYNAFDLNETKGKVDSNAGPNFNGISYKCDGDFFIPGTLDNHYAYDYGTGNCNKDFVGAMVNGMSIGFNGIITSVGTHDSKYAIKVDYGNIMCTDEKVHHIVIQFGHSIPLVKVGDIVDSSSNIAELEIENVEIEIMVIDADTGITLNPDLIGLSVKCPSFCK